MITFDIKDGIIFVLATLATTLVTWLYLNYERTYNYFKLRNFPHPEPVPIFGNILPLLFQDPVQVRLENHRKFGKVYGYFWCNSPRLNVADADVTRQITQGDFESFVNHDLELYSNKYQAQFLTHLKDDQWRRMRALMTPTFTSAKIQQMYGLLVGASNDLIDQFEEQLAKALGETGEPSYCSNINQSFKMYAMDTIAICCYGFSLNSRQARSEPRLTKIRDEFIRDAQLVQQVSLWRIMLGSFVPKWIQENLDFEVYPSSLYEPIAAKTAQIVESRRKSAKKCRDFLNSLLEAKLDDGLQFADSSVTQNEDHHAGMDENLVFDSQEHLVNQVKSSQSADKISLNDQEILCSAIFFLIVGIDTTANLLSSVVYSLAFHQEAQEKLYQVISRVATKGSDGNYEFDYEEITTMSYLDAVISETLRMFPPVVAIDRKANQACHLDNIYFTVPKGMIIDLDYASVMRDPDYWSQPDDFRPERFLPQNRRNIIRGSYCPFGLGPRHCLGMRFALTETKLALAKLIMTCKFEPAPETHFPPEMTGHVAMTWIKDPRVMVKSRIFYLFADQSL